MSNKTAGPVLELERCTMRFGGLTAVSNLNMTVGNRELLGLIGPNGAGKTTVFNLITGVYRPTEGEIRFAGSPISGMKPCRINFLGVARTFQNIRLFPSLTVFDNVRVAFNQHLSGGMRHALWRGRAFYEEEAHIERKVMEILDVFNLSRVRHAPAKSLPYGDQRRLEIVRALATSPKLLLLDEPAAGMNPSEKVQLVEWIQFIQKKYQIAVLLVEHDMQVVMGICERIVVLDYGEQIACGTPAVVGSHPKVIEAYLGQVHAGN